MNNSKDLKEAYGLLLDLHKRLYNDYAELVEKTIGASTTQPTPTSLQEDKADWEIVSFDTYNHGDYYRKNMDGYFSGSVMRENYTQEELIKQKRNIHSVKRLSDQTIFTVGDKVVHKTDGLINTATIFKFVIPNTFDNMMWFELEEGKEYCKDLSNFNKLNLQPVIDKLNGCGICGGQLVLIRGRYPSCDKREVCPTCTTERLEQINEISSREYGKTVQSN